MSTVSAKFKALVNRILPKTGPALVAKVIGSFDQMVADLERAALQIERQREEIFDALDLAYLEYERINNATYAQNDVLTKALQRAEKVKTNIVALVGN